MAKPADLGEELDALYRGLPEGFVAARDELAKKLKGDGCSEDAARVKKLRRPSQAAALVNWLSFERRSDLERFAASAASMRDQATAGDGKKLRAAVKKERELVQGLLAAAEEELASRGGSGSSQTLDRVGETLRAIPTDPDLERSVLAGRLDKEGEASTIGFELPVTASSGRSKSAGAKKAEKGPDAKAEKATLQTLQRNLEAAEEREEELDARVERAEQRLAAARDGLAGAKADTKAARTEHRKQERRVKKLADG